MKNFVKDMSAVGTFGFSIGLGVAGVFALCKGVDKLIDITIEHFEFQRKSKKELKNLIN